MNKRLTFASLLVAIAATAMMTACGHGSSPASSIDASATRSDAGISDARASVRSPLPIPLAVSPTDLAPGSAGQVFLTLPSGSGWATISGDGTMSSAGVLTVSNVHGGGTPGQALYTSDAGTAVWLATTGDQWCSVAHPGTCYVVALSGDGGAGGAIPLAAGAYISTSPVIASPKIITTSDGGQILGFDGTYVYVDNPGGALGIGTSGSTGVYLGSSTPTTVQGTLYTDNVQPSSDGAWTSGTSNARWSQTFTEAVTAGNLNALPIETNWQFAPTTNLGDAGTNGNVWHKAYGYNTSAATAQTVASGSPGNTPWFCPAIGTVSMVTVDFALKQNSAPANNSSGRVTNTCWTVADAGAWVNCGTTTEVGSENVNGSPCSGGAYAVTVAAGSGGCFVVDATCAGIAGNSDALFVVTVVNN